MENENKTLSLAKDLEAVGREYGRKRAHKEFLRRMDSEFAKAKAGEIIDLTSLMCGAEAVREIKD